MGQSDIDKLTVSIASHPLAGAVNAKASRWDISIILKGETAYCRALIRSWQPAAIFATAAQDFKNMVAPARMLILAGAAKELTDTELLRHQHRIRRLLDSSDQPTVQTDIDPPARLLSDYQRLALLLRLSRLGIVPRPLVDQDEFLSRLTHEANGMSVSFEELLSLADAFTPTGSTVEDLTERFKVWLKDPEGGAKAIKDGFGFKIGDLATSYHDPKPLEEYSLEEAIARVDLLISLGPAGREHAAVLAEELLFKRSPIGIACFEHMCDLGYREMMLEGSYQILRAYGIALAANDRTADAMAVAMTPSITYEDYSWIQIAIAQKQRDIGGRRGCCMTLDALAEIDPELNFMKPATDETSTGLSPEPGYMNEMIAELYSEVGEYQSAVESYRRSRQYPEQSEKKLAQYAIANGEPERYLEAVLGCLPSEHETIFMVSRLTISLLNQLDASRDMGTTLTAEHPAMVRRIEILEARLEQIREAGPADNIGVKVAHESLIDIYTLTGRYQEALHLIDIGKSMPPAIASRKLSQILTNMVKDGDLDTAITTFDRYEHKYNTLGRLDVPRFNVHAMGAALMKGDIETFNRFYEQLPDYTRQARLFEMLTTFKGQDLKITDEVAGLILTGKGEDGYATITKAMEFLGRVFWDHPRPFEGPTMEMAVSG